MTKDEHYRIALAVKQACIEAARQGFEDAAISGLCGEGAIEAGISAIEMVDIDRLVAKSIQEDGT